MPNIMYSELGKIGIGPMSILSVDIGLKYRRNSDKANIAISAIYQTDISVYIGMNYRRYPDNVNIGDILYR